MVDDDENEHCLACFSEIFDPYPIQSLVIVVNGESSDLLHCLIHFSSLLFREKNPFILFSYEKDSPP